MITKVITPKDSHLALASIIIKEKSKYQQVELLLSELIYYSTSGIVYDTHFVKTRICVKFKLTSSHYAMLLSKLIKLSIVAKGNDVYYLSPEVTKEYDNILIQKGNSKK